MHPDTYKPEFQAKVTQGIRMLLSVDYLLTLHRRTDQGDRHSWESVPFLNQGRSACHRFYSFPHPGSGIPLSNGKDCCVFCLLWCCSWKDKVPMGVGSNFIVLAWAYLMRTEVLAELEVPSSLYMHPGDYLVAVGRACTAPTTRGGGGARGS